MCNQGCRFLKKLHKNLFRYIGILYFLLSASAIYAQIPYVYNVENTGASYPLPPLPNLGSLPRIENLPDPFRWASDPQGSTRATGFSDWSHHRAEIKAQVEYYEIGTKPDVDSSQVTASYSGGTLTVRVTAGGNTLTLTCAVSLPSGSGPFPAVIGMNSATGGLPSSSFTSRNIARITYSHDQVTKYGSPSNSDPYYRLYPNLNINNTGQYSAWAWGVSRIIDGLEKTQGSLPVDLEHIAVTGCSYAGKMALFAGAFDERIALTIAQESGGGGATSWRYSQTEASGSVEGLGQTDHNWFKESMFDFAGSNVSYLPEDHHMLMAMCAPRALYVTGNTDYTWLSNPSCYVCSRATQQVYNTLGVADRFGFGIDGGHTHCAFPSGFNADLNYFLDKFMSGQTSLTRSVQVYPSSYSSINYASWYQWWGPTSGPTPTGPTNPPTPTGPPTPTPSPTLTSGNIIVRARGTMGGEIMELRVNNTVLASWTMSASYQNYYANGSGTTIDVYFTNDDQLQNGMDIQVDYIQYNGTTYQAEDQETNTGVYVNGACGGSYSDMLQCNGYIRFNVTNNPTPTPGGIAGDVNSDGSVNIIDALMTAQYSVGLDPGGFNIDRADVNCDSTVNIIDALMIAQYYVGLVNTLDC